jgi:hypothetical protein
MSTTLLETPIYYYLVRLETQRAVLNEALYELYRVQRSPWCKEDLPRALDDVLDAIGRFEGAVEQLAENISKALFEEQGQERTAAADYSQD